MLDAALADLAVHDEEDASEPASGMPGDDLVDGIPEMTLDKNLAAGRPAAKADTTAPAVPAKVAAEMEKNKAGKEPAAQAEIDSAVPPQVAAEMEKNKAAREPAAQAEIDSAVPPQVAAEMEKNKATKQAAAKEEPKPTAIDNLAAEAEKAESIEDVSDKLAETLFGSEELEAISLKIREKAQQKRLDAKARAAGDDAAPSPTPEAAQANAESEPPSASEAPAAAEPAAAGEKPLELVAEEPVTPKPAPDAEKPPEPAAEKTGATEACVRTRNDREPVLEVDDENFESPGCQRHEENGGPKKKKKKKKKKGEDTESIQGRTVGSPERIVQELTRNSRAHLETSLSPLRMQSAPVYCEIVEPESAYPVSST